MTPKTFFTVLVWLVCIALIAVTLDWYTKSTNEKEINAICANRLYAIYQRYGQEFVDCEANGDDLQFVKVGDRYSLRCVYQKGSKSMYETHLNL